MYCLAFAYGAWMHRSFFLATLTVACKFVFLSTFTKRDRWRFDWLALLHSGGLNHGVGCYRTVRIFPEIFLLGGGFGGLARAQFFCDEISLMSNLGAFSVNGLLLLW